MKHLKVITWCRWKLLDSYDKRYCTNFTASVLRPSFEYPLASCSMSVVKGNYRVFIRFGSLEEMRAFFKIPSVHMEKLGKAYREAKHEAEVIQSHQKSLHRMGGLSPESYVVRTDTGEIIAEAERIIQEGNE